MVAVIRALQGMVKDGDEIVMLVPGPRGSLAVIHLVFLPEWFPFVFPRYPRQRPCKRTASQVNLPTTSVTTGERPLPTTSFSSLNRE